MPYTPNNDTVYSGALIQLDEEPIILSVPTILNRYWSVEVADNMTNNLFYIGSRATGGKAGHHAFVGPNWKGKLPKDVIVHHIPSNAMMIAIRIGVQPDDAKDLQAVNNLQEKFALTSLDNWHKAGRFGIASIPKMMPRPIYKGDLAFFQTLADLLNEDPLPKGHEAAQMQLARIGIIPGKPFDVDHLTEAQHRGLAHAAEDGARIVEWKKKYRGTPYPTRWNNLRPGTYGVDYLDRAVGAVEGLFVHDREEAVYFSTYEDGDANLLDGSNRYVMHFDKGQIPTTLKNGFWSLTMYRADGRNLAKNPINRFSIGDRTKGLTYNTDGSLDIYVQSTAPQGHESNWLPSPQIGVYRINYRVYLPTEKVRTPDTMSQFLPPIKKVE